MLSIIKEDLSSINSYKQQFKDIVEKNGIDSDEFQDLISRASNDNNITYSEYEKLLNWVYDNYCDVKYEESVNKMIKLRINEDFTDDWDNENRYKSLKFRKIDNLYDTKENNLNNIYTVKNSVDDIREFICSLIEKCRYRKETVYDILSDYCKTGSFVSDYDGFEYFIKLDEKGDFYIW